MHIHVLGICGKFMSGLAIIARQMGFKVTGCDQNLLPTFVKDLQAFDIDIRQGYEVSSLDHNADYVIIGNALSRGRAIIEYILDRGIPYYSGPEWLGKHVLQHKWVLAVSGTHGKTTTTSMLTWMLEKAGLNPGFLVGGNPVNFTTSARYTDSNFFVIEADEYDTAFFDKRSKFLHYYPNTLIINNIEFDHADIFKDLDAIKTQFRHLLRVVPNSGLIVTPAHDENVNSVLAAGCWTPCDSFGHSDANWLPKIIKSDASMFEVYHLNHLLGTVNWNLVGQHNMYNAVAALAAARHIGILPETAIQALNSFEGVRRRLELKGVINEVSIYDDFAHHPTAIAATISGLRQKVGHQRIFAVLEFASNTMRSGYHQDKILAAFEEADNIILLRPKERSWDIDQIFLHSEKPIRLFDNVEQIIRYLTEQCRAGDNVLLMSNLNFDGIQQKLLDAFATMPLNS